MTDLQRELRATLIEAGDQAPVVEDLAARASRPVRRHRAWLTAGVATLATAAAGVVIAVAGPAAQDVATTPAAGPSASAQELKEALLGTWMPVDVPVFGGQTPGSSTRPAGRVVDIAFRTDGRWRGSDGCNGVGGTYVAGDDGTFSAEVGPSTMMGCDNVLHTTVIGQADRFEINGPTLSFYAADGRLLGTYQRT